MSERDRLYSEIIAEEVDPPPPVPRKRIRPISDDAMIVKVCLYVQSHPGCTEREIREAVSSTRNLKYELTKLRVTGLVREESRLIPSEAKTARGIAWAKGRMKTMAYYYPSDSR